MDNRAYWIWASAALGPGAFTDSFLGLYPDARALFESSQAERRISGAFTPAQLKRLESVTLDDAGRSLSICEKNQWRVLCYDEPDYPDSLRKINDSPLVLYVWGDLSGINSQFCFGIVGTRNPTPESVEVARQISAELSQAGAVIISGGALGIDSAAHEGALDAGGKTVSVLGCGLGTRYLMGNASLRSRISKSGAVISEFSPLSTASKITFPIRNRIISGLSKGILVVEAGEKSGSIITANCAFDQGREVFAVPGSVTTSAYAGANRLIRDGARAVSCAGDIIRDFDELIPGALKAPEESAVHSVSKTEPKKKPPVGLNEDEKAVYAAFGTEPVYPAELALACGLPLQRVMTLLISLEIKDFITSLPGGRYSIC